MKNTFVFANFLKNTIQNGFPSNGEFWFHIVSGVVLTFPPASGWPMPLVLAGVPLFL